MISLSMGTEHDMAILIRCIPDTELPYFVVHTRLDYDVIVRIPSTMQSNSMQH
jgi:hypothetical protein